MADQENQGEGPTKEQLLDRAGELEIEGRGSMNKAELTASIEVAQSAAAKKAQEGAPSYERERLIKEAPDIDGLRQPSFIVSGALADLGGTGDLTVAQTAEAVDRYLNREVKEA